MDRREMLASLCLALGASFPFATAADTPYPSRAVRLLVGFPPGSATDVAARAVSEAMARQLGQPFVVDNKPGAASNIAAKVVASAPPDGYTLFVATVANVINASFPNAGSPDLEKDFAPIALIGSVPNLLVVHPSLGVSSVDELIAAAKAKPGQISFASSGHGTSPHLSGELFCAMSGVKMLHVPYRGSTAAVVDLLGGQVQVMFSPASTVLPHIRAGKLKALASTGATRTSIAPDLPTIDELGLKGFETSVWFGFVAPTGTPLDIVTKLQQATQTALETQEVQQLFRAQGIDALKSTSQAFTRHIQAERVKWTQLILSSGIKPE